MRILRQPMILLLLAVAPWSSLWAQERPKEAAPEQRTHVVRKGDTLWDLARQYLSNPFQWPRIFDANRSAIRDPHWIYPEQRFLIPPVMAADAVAVEAQQGEPAQPAEQPVAGVQPVALEEAVAPRPPSRTLFYPGAQLEQAVTPSGREIELLEGATLLEVQPGESEAAAWLADRDELDVVGRLVEEVGVRQDRDKLIHSMHPRSLAYVSYEDFERRPAVGQQLLVVAVGRGAGRWGRIIEPTAVATVRELADEVMVVELSRQFGPVHAGNLALPMADFAGAPAARVAVADGPEGEVIDFRTRQPRPSVPDQAFVDLGRAQGLEVGDELVAYQPERWAPNASVWLPEEQVARLTVLRAEEESATVRVTALKQPVLERGLPVRLVRRTR